MIRKYIGSNFSLDRYESFAGQTVIDWNPRKAQRRPSRLQAESAFRINEICLLEQFLKVV